MILLNLDSNNGIPPYRQILKGIIDLIDRGVMKTGTSLPSTRELGTKLGVNRSTVYKAYQELIMLGYLESRPGSYTRVRNRTKIATHRSEEKDELLRWKERLSPYDGIYEGYLKDIGERLLPVAAPLIDFTRISLDSRLYPIEDYRRCLNNVLVNKGKEILDYGDPCGYLPLRQFLADRLQIHSISASAEDIMITNGSQQALELLFRLLLSKGKKVIVESPTYGEMIPLLKLNNAEVTTIPMRSDGMDLEALENRLKETEYAFIYTMPGFHNPTGITTKQSHRERLLHLAEKYCVPVIEDGFEEEMKYFGKIVLPIKSMDKHQIVIYVGTFSKVLFAGMRIGWVVGHKELIRRLSAFKKFGDLGGNILLQASLDQFCRKGYYDMHVKRMQRIYRKRMQVALESMQQEFPENVSWIKPEGGYIIWISIKGPKIDKEIFKNIMLKNNVAVLWGDLFYFSRNQSNNFRLSISQLNEEEIKKGIVFLGKALRELKNKLIRAK